MPEQTCTKSLMTVHTIIRTIVQIVHKMYGLVMQDMTYCRIDTSSEGHIQN